MAFRNLSPQRMFEELASRHVPECSFRRGVPFARWKRQTLPKVLDTLGAFPGRVPANAELTAEWQHEGLRKQRWLIDVQEGLSASVLVNYPDKLKRGEKRPAILCWSGHGAFGKEPVMGNDSSPEMREAIQRHNYNYGHQMAKAGFVTFSVDWLGMGEHNETRKPNFRSQGGGRDWCNLYYLHATMLGMSPISINVAHGMAATEFVCGLPGVDGDQLGVMGLSGGGTMTLWSALCDARFRAAEIICYSGLWAHFGVSDVNYCGMQVAPGLYKLIDLPDAQGLIAPRPLLVDIGVYDTCFVVDEAKACFDKVERIYKAAGASKALELDLFPGEHGWGGNKSAGFFAKHLGLEA